MIRSQSVVFTRPHSVEIQVKELPALGDDQVLVQSKCSAISAGTEMLAYRDQLPKEMPLDASIAALAGPCRYPFSYGYAVVGTVAAVGAGVDRWWQDRRVFAFHPHQSWFVTRPADLVAIPQGIDPESALFLANMETAVNLVMDGHPMMGERVVVLGQGIVGLLTTTLLARHPLGELLSCDRHGLRRKASRAEGATTYKPQDLAAVGQGDYLGRADLVYELSGNPRGLDLAVAVAGFDARIVVGSWYGAKPVPLNLGGRFHRERIHLTSSQVSTIAPLHTGRWTQRRRIELAWEMIRKVDPRRWITHRVAIEDADQAYRLLDTRPEQTLQVILRYPDRGGT